MLEKVERVTVDKIVAENLKLWIVENNLQPGDKLPSEQQLSEELGVARHTLREGIKRLTQLGIVESRVGSGIYINSVNFDNFAEYMLFLMQRKYISRADIYAVRFALECAVAREAAININDEHIEILHDRMELLRTCCDSGDFENYVTQDISFHMDLAEATGNHLFSGIISALRQVFVEHMSSLDKATARNSQQQHEMIFDAVMHHDPELAESKMKEHLIDISQSYFV